MADQQATEVPSLPMLVGRIDEASLDEIIAWARHPHVCMGNIAGQVIERLIRELPTWQSMDSSLKDGTRILVAYPVGPGPISSARRHVFVAVHDGLSWVSDGAWRLHEEPIAWMPLPAPPTSPE